MYADKITKSMQETLTLTRDRRKRQEKYNKDHKITPQTIKKSLIEQGPGASTNDYMVVSAATDGEEENIEARIEAIKEEMLMAAAALEFERAAKLRDELKELVKEGHPVKKRKRTRSAGRRHR